jgi:hypothetical protein
MVNSKVFTYELDVGSKRRGGIKIECLRLENWKNEIQQRIYLCRSKRRYFIIDGDFALEDFSTSIEEDLVGEEKSDKSNTKKEWKPFLS